jgi:alpha-ketoglutarate-dependent taurine dioxygenase
MRTRYPIDGVTMPLLAEPADGDEGSPPALIDWASGNRPTLDGWLQRDGAVLFRGFGIDSPETFHDVAAAMRPELMRYVGGDSPRTSLGDNVYTSTEFPPELEIGLHNELSYTHAWPGHLFFCCLVAAELGGETHIADGRRVLEALDPDVRDRFSQRAVAYCQHLRDESLTGPGKSWQESFETSDRAEVERICRAQDMKAAWSDRGLLTKLRNPAMVKHPITGDACWFNQADLWHARFGTVKEQEAKGRGEGEGEPLGCHACFGDGSEIAIVDLEAVRSAYARTEVVFPWHAGDVLVLDNVLAMHGRKPFHGARRVLVAMA